MNSMNELPEELLDLLAQKSYQELNATEREMVSRFLSPESYDEYASLVSDFQQMDQELPATAPQLKLPEPQEKRSKLYQLFTYRIPAYQAVAAIFLALVLFQFSTASRSGSVTDDLHTLGKDTASTPSTYGVQKVGTPLSEDDYPEELIFNL